MTKEDLKKLKEIVGERWIDLYRKAVQEHPKIHAIGQLGKAASKWRHTCRTLDIEMVDEPIDYEPGGQILEELVAVSDPNPNGMWLIMTHETAEKILLLGIP